MESPLFWLWLVLAYLCGAVPWSVWLGHLFFKVDPRSVGDGNPGAANAWRVGGWRLGVAVLVLDFLKAFIPVGLAKWVIGFPDDQLFWIALMPSLGHAVSIFLRLRGGRALVTWFGAWAGLTLYEVPLVMGAAAIAGTRLFKKGEARALVVPVALLVYLLARGAPGWMLALAAVQLLILIAKLAAYYLSPRRELQSKP
jgi:acyl phosphate:glycerol-3-phosphate acyltransferase